MRQNVVKMQGLGVPNYGFSFRCWKYIPPENAFSQRVLGAWQKQNILGPSTLQALSIYRIHFITRWDIFSENREEGANNRIVIKCYKFITFYNNL